jgi:hypothetical protein
VRSVTGRRLEAMNIEFEGSAMVEAITMPQLVKDRLRKLIACYSELLNVQITNSAVVRSFKCSKRKLHSACFLYLILIMCFVHHILFHSHIKYSICLKP